MNEKVSVIVPVYNVEAYLDRCLTSIANQSYSNLEIIIVNDGSTDSSDDICQKFARKDTRITLLTKDNGGLSSARNYGIDHSSGDYVTFIDSDDFVDTNYIDHLVKSIQKENSDIVSTNFTPYYNINTEPLESAPTNESILTLDATSALRLALYGKKTTLHACFKLYKRDLFSNVRFPEGRLYEDMGTTYKLISKASSVTISSSAKYFYLRRPDSITGLGYSIKILDLLDFSEEIVEYTKINHPRIVSSAKYNLFSSSIVIMQSILGSHNNRKLAREDLNRALSAATGNAWSVLRAKPQSIQRTAFAVAAAISPSILKLLIIIKIKLLTTSPLRRI